VSAVGGDAFPLGELSVVELSVGIPGAYCAGQACEKFLRFFTPTQGRAGTVRKPAELTRMPEYSIDRDVSEQYENHGIVNGWKNVHASFTPGVRTGSAFSL
jgi:hypothetical protein